MFKMPFYKMVFFNALYDWCGIFQFCHKFNTHLILKFLLTNPLAYSNVFSFLACLRDVGMCVGVPSNSMQIKPLSYEVKSKQKWKTTKRLFCKISLNKTSVSQQKITVIKSL